MSRLNRRSVSRKWLRWLPAIVVPAVIAAGTAASFAVGGVNIPDKTPQQVLAMVQQNSVHSFSGTVKQSSNLGLPDLVSTRRSGDSQLSSMVELITGAHTARVFVDGPANLRIQIMDTLAERDLIRHGRTLWLYNSGEQKAARITMRQASGISHPITQGDGLEPNSLARKLLAAIKASTKVTLGDNTSVAGRSAYDLVLTPRTSKTLVGSISIAVDSKTGMPLRVDVQARGQHDPAVSVAFTELKVQKPDADLFTFTPPPGTSVKTITRPAKRPLMHPGGIPGAQNATPGKRPMLLGSGWTSVIELPTGMLPAKLADSPLLEKSTTPVADGRVLSTSLVTVLLANDGRVFAGAVPAEVLQAAATR